MAISQFSAEFTFLLNKVTHLQVTIWEWTKPILCSIWGHFDRAKAIFKILLASWTFNTVWKGFRSFNAENLRSVGQRTAKLLAIKLWEWFGFARNRTEADWLKWRQGRMADFFLRPPTLTASNFAALWPTDPIFPYGKF